jgi:hypothetical protein
MDPEVLSQSFDQLDWGVATANLLVQLGVRAVGDIVKLTPHDVLARPNGTRSALREIQEQLGELGLELSPPQPGKTPALPGIDDSGWGCLFVWQPEADEEQAARLVRQAVIDVYARAGAGPVGPPEGVFTPLPLERQSATALGDDELFVFGGPVGWVAVMSHRWEWSPAGKHPLALALSERLSVLSLTQAPPLYREISLYEAGKLNSMITLGPEAPRVPPELPALDLVPLAKRGGVPMSLLRKGLHASHRTFINLAGLAWESWVGFRRELGEGNPGLDEAALVLRKR